jgi:hypothetical protein
MIFFPPTWIDGWFSHCSSHPENHSLSYSWSSEWWYKVSFDLTAEIFNDTLGKHLTHVIPSTVPWHRDATLAFRGLCTDTLSEFQGSPYGQRGSETGLPPNIFSFQSQFRRCSIVIYHRPSRVRRAQAAWMLLKPGSSFQLQRSFGLHTEAGYWSERHPLNAFLCASQWFPLKRKSEHSFIP